MNYFVILIKQQTNNFKLKIMNFLVIEDLGNNNVELNPSKQTIGTASSMLYNLSRNRDMIGRSISSRFTVDAFIMKVYLSAYQLLPLMMLNLPREFAKTRNALRLLNRKINQFATKYSMSMPETDKQKYIGNLFSDFQQAAGQIDLMMPKIEKIFAMQYTPAQLSEMRSMVDARSRELGEYVKMAGGVYDDDNKEAEFTQLQSLEGLTGSSTIPMLLKYAVKYPNIYAVGGMSIISESAKLEQMGKLVLNIPKMQEEFYNVLINPTANNLSGYQSGYQRGTRGFGATLSTDEIKKMLFNDEKEGGEEVMTTNEVKYDAFGNAISNPYIKVVNADVSVPVLVDYAPRNPINEIVGEAPIIMTMTGGSGGRSENDGVAVVLDNQAVTSTGADVKTTPINTVAVVDKDTKEVISVAADFGNGIITKPLVDVATGKDAASVAVDIKGNPIAVVQKDASGNVQTVTVTSATGQTKDVPVVSTKELPKEIKSQAVINASTVLPTGQTVAATVAQTNAAGRDETSNTPKVIDDKDFNKNLMYLGGAVGVALLLKFFLK